MSPKQQHQAPAKAIEDLRCAAKKGYYALTFDAGPSAATTPRLVATLSKAKAVATFFGVGQRATRRRYGYPLIVGRAQHLVELQRSVGQIRR